VKPRCSWAGRDPIYINYHDTQWGVPLHDDRRLFEFLILEGAQAGLRWLTILKKRLNYRKAFDKSIIFPKFGKHEIHHPGNELLTDILRDRDEGGPLQIPRNFHGSAG